MAAQPAQCQIVTALNIIVGKWKPLILLHLLRGGKKRFSELKNLMPDITQKMLTAQLRELEQELIIERYVYAQVPPKVEYSITEYGKSLEPVLEVIHDWGKSHLEYVRVHEDQKQQLLSNVTDSQPSPATSEK